MTLYRTIKFKHREKYLTNKFEYFSLWLNAGWTESGKAPLWLKKVKSCLLGNPAKHNSNRKALKSILSVNYFNNTAGYSKM